MPTPERFDAGIRELARLGLLMLFVSVATAVAIGVELYSTALAQHRERLMGIVDAQAETIGAIDRFNRERVPEDRFASPEEATLAEIRAGQSALRGFGATGEFTLAARDGEWIEFLSDLRHTGPAGGSRLPLDGVNAEPMLRALGGETGTLIGLDYRGVVVMAAYRPVKELGLGLVAKLDMAEVRAPFVRAGLIGAGICLVLILFGALLFIRIGNPIVQRLAASERKFRFLIENSPAITYEVVPGESARRLYVNPLLGEAFGFTAEDWSTQPRLFEERLHAEDRERVLEAIRRARTSGDPFCGEYRLVAKDGKIIWIQDEAVLLRNRSDEPNRLQGVMLDITARKQADEELRFIRFAVEHNADPTYWVREDGKICYANEAASRTLGYSREELRSMTVPDINPDYPPESWPAHWERAKRAQSLVLETRHRSKSGRVFPIEVQISHVDYQGEQYAWAYARDITARKQAEEALQKLVEVTSSKLGSSFFESMVTHLAKALDADYTLIGELHGDLDDSVRTIAVAIDGELADDFEYDLAGTPCQGVVGQSSCSFASGVADMFPDDPLLKQMNVEGYIGVPLFGSQDTVLGIMLALFRKPITNLDAKESMLQVLAARTGSELERLRSDEALAKSEERLQMVLRGSNLGTWDWSIETGEVTHNQRWARMLGYSLDETKPRMSTWEGMVHPDDLPRVQVALDEHLNGKTDLYETEYRMRHKSGRWVWVLDRGSVTERDASGTPTRVSGTHLDITERKLSAAALESSEERFRAIFRSATDGIVIADKAGTIIEWNQAAGAIFGYERHEIVGEPLEVLVPERLRERHRQGFERARARGELGFDRDIFEVTGLRKNDLEFPLEISLAVFGQDGDTLLGGLFRDLSERRRWEGDLARLGTAIDQVGEAVMITDPAATIEYVNPAFEKITGYSIAEVIGENPRLLKSGEHGEAFYKNYWDTISNGKIWRGYITNRKKDGSLYDSEVTVSPVFNDDGAIRNYISVSRDVSEQRGLEKQLRQTQKIEAVGRLAGGIAHDFNNLLTAILGYADLGRSALDSDHPAYGDLVGIQEAGERAANLTHQLLAFSRQQVLQPKVLDLNQIVTDIGALCRRTIGETIRLVTKLDPRLSRIKADQGQIEQVLMNLAINARDAMPRGGDLVVETCNVILDESYAAHHVAVQPGDYVAMTITDTGCGMSQEVQNRIFEPFFTTKSPEQGTGLGLATVYGIVKQSGGYIWVYSEPGQGSTFKILLPQVATKVVDPLAKPTEHSRVVGARTILLVEDSPMVRDMTVRVLKDEGHRVLSTENAEDALNLDQDLLEELDLVLTDLVLPDMNGLALSREIRSRSPELPVIVMSGYSKAAKLRGQLERSGVSFLQKPFVQADLLRALDTALTSSRGEQPAPGSEDDPEQGWQR